MGSAILIPPPHSGQKAPTPSPPPLSPISGDNSSPSSLNPFYVPARTFQGTQRLDGLVWTNEERAALQASPIIKAKQESLSLFWKLEREVGLQEALDCFQSVLDSGREVLEHDAMSCGDCWVNGDIVYCERSKYHPNHPYHCCSAWQNCYCLAPEYSRDLSCYPDPNVQ